MGSRHIAVRILHLAGSEPDALTELEVRFLDSLLPLFDVEADVPRAQVDTVRVGTLARLVDNLTWGDADVIHVSSHGGKGYVQVGSRDLKLREFRAAMADRDPIDAVVVSTACEMATPKWVDAWLEAGAKAFIGAKRALWAKDAAIFSAAFYSAFFGTTHRGRSEAQRAFDAYRVAHAAYQSFVPTGSRARFYWHPGPEYRRATTGRKTLEPIVLR